MQCLKMGPKRVAFSPASRQTRACRARVAAEGASRRSAICSGTWRRSSAKRGGEGESETEECTDAPAPPAVIMPRLEEERIVADRKQQLPNVVVAGGEEVVVEVRVVETSRAHLTIR